MVSSGAILAFFTFLHYVLCCWWSVVVLFLFLYVSTLCTLLLVVSSGAILAVFTFLHYVLCCWWSVVVLFLLSLLFYIMCCVVGGQ